MQNSLNGEGLTTIEEADRECSLSLSFNKDKEDSVSRLSGEEDDDDENETEETEKEGVFSEGNKPITDILFMIQLYPDLIYCS